MERGETGPGTNESRIDMLEPGLRRILAPNPSPMTGRGTNTYVLGDGEVAVIDPGPAIAAHMDAILSALRPEERVSAILVTHSHLDHSPLARPLAERTGAPIHAAGPSDWGRSPVMEALARSGQLGGGEGVDPDFRPDRPVGDSDVIPGGWGEIGVVATPGHMANHISFAWRDMLFSGDMVMGWSTSLVSPPDGDMGAFMASMTRLAARSDRVYYPGHGDPVLDPSTRVAELIAHRTAREVQIAEALDQHGPDTARGLAKRIYVDVDPRLLPAAERNVLAHLIDMFEKKRVSSDGEVSANAQFRLR